MKSHFRWIYMPWTLRRYGKSASQYYCNLEYV